MGILELFLLSLGLSMDNMAVASASACDGSSFSLSEALKTAAVFSLLGAVFMCAGWFGGANLERYISSWDHWLAFFILVFIGFKMIREAISRDGGACGANISFKSPKTLAAMALATNIDVLAVGVSLALYQVSLLLLMPILVFCIASATLAGFALASKAGPKLGNKAGLAGGAVLIILSFKILIEGIK